ncbi:MAG: type II secretion system F family protein [Sporichthyaceae bacterium]
MSAGWIRARLRWIPAPRRALMVRRRLASVAAPHAPLRARWRGRDPGAGEPRPGEAAIAADLLAACLSAGCTPEQGAAAVAQALGGAVGAVLDEVAVALRAGAEPALAWEGVADLTELALISRALVRSAETGVAVAGVVAAEAARVRARRRDGASAALARVNTLAALPLALCFLPAFMCLGVLPVVISLAASVLQGGVWTDF